VNVGLLLLWQRLVEQQQRQIDDAVIEQAIGAQALKVLFKQQAAVVVEVRHQR